MMTVAGTVSVDRFIDADYLGASGAAVHYVRAQASRVLAELGFWEQGGQERSIHALGNALGISPAALPAFGWLLDEAVGAGRASRGAEGGYAASSPRPTDDDLARAARYLETHAPLVGSSKPMLDYIADRYGSVLTGQRSAMSVLLKGDGLRLWESYFSAANPLYDVHNRLAAAGLRAAWPARRSRPARVIEHGTGTGGATAALVDALGDLPDGADADLIVSDVSPTFLVRVAERFRASACRLRTARIDFNRPVDEQGIGASTADAIVATNALHAATDLRATLTFLRRAIAPGGVLIVSESLCSPGASVHQEFVFNLLGGLPRRADRESRFLSAERWQKVLQESGWTAEVLANSRGPQLAMLAVAI